MEAETTAFVVARPTPRAPRSDLHAVVAAHGGHDAAEDRALDEARDDVPGLEEIDRVADIGRGVEAQPRGADEEAAEDADAVAHRHQQGQRQGGGQHAGHGEVFHRVGGERDQRVDLFGDLHRADLGGDGGGDAARDHEPAEDGPKFPRDADGDDLGHHGLGVEARAAGVDLQRQRAAGEKRREAHHGQREPADVQKLVRQFARVPGRAEDVAESVTK
jgi:hypothetical protein